MDKKIKIVLLNKMGYLNGLKEELEKYLENYHFYDNKNLKNLSIGLLVNNELNGYQREYFNDKLLFIEFNEPSKLDGKQDQENRKFKKFIKSLDVNRFINEQIQLISIIVLYNNSFDNVKIKGISMNLEKKDSFSGISNIFLPKKPKYKMNQVILSENLEKEIKQTLLILERQKLIYETWGFEDIEPAPKAILNFYGPSGTGKTMTANAIADYMQSKIIALNYADIESKFVGDAPKNLIKAFEIASKEKALLFFDEADSFLGKRITNISSSSDQAVNSLRSQLLILLEDFKGIIIFATNLIDNYDKAFESRIFKHIKFELPDREHRKLIIEKSIPSKVPFHKDKKGLSASELEELVEISENFSGRHIKNSILDSLTTAIISEREYLIFDDFKLAFKKTAKTINNLNYNNKQKIKLESKIKERLSKRSKFKNRYRTRVI